jgi:arylsulfatase A-like enzyme
VVSFGQGDKDGGLEEMLGLTMHQCNLMVLRGNKFKLIQFNGNLPPLLYNIQDDPGESENLANNPAYASIMLELTQEALKHRMTFVDRGLAESMSSTATDGSRLVTITRRAHLLDRRAAGVAIAAKM